VGSPSPGIRARIKHAGGSSWIDIIVVGVDSDARTLCERIVARELRMKVGNIVPRTTQPCGPDAFPPTMTSAFVLVDTVEVKPSDFVLEDAVEGRREPSGGDAKATVETFGAYDNRAACERMLAQLVESDSRVQADRAEAMRAFLASQLVEAKRQVKDKCSQAQRDCTHLDASGRLMCDAENADFRRACADATEHQHEVEQFTASPKPISPGVVRQCRSSQ
jgi:hypothetical protein